MVRFLKYLNCSFGDLRVHEIQCDRKELRCFSWSKMVIVLVWNADWCIAISRSKSQRNDDNDTKVSNDLLNLALWFIQLHWMRMIQAPHLLYMLCFICLLDFRLCSEFSSSTSATVPHLSLLVLFPTYLSFPRSIFKLKNSNWPMYLSAILFKTEKEAGVCALSLSLFLCL